MIGSFERSGCTSVPCPVNPRSSLFPASCAGGTSLSQAVSPTIRPVAAIENKMAFMDDLIVATYVTGKRGCGRESVVRSSHGPNRRSLLLPVDVRDRLV